jgi:hypothetical protein
MPAPKKNKNYINIESNKEIQTTKKLDSFFKQDSNNSIVLDNKLNNEIGSNEIGSNEIGSNEIGSNEIGSNEIGSNEIANNMNNNIGILSIENLQKNTMTIGSVTNVECFSHSDIRSKMDKLTDDEYLEIFKIVKGAGEKYSINKNGIFINLNTLRKTTIQEISNFLYFCESNDRLLYEDEKTREIYKQSIAHE